MLVRLFMSFDLFAFTDYISLYRMPGSISPCPRRDYYQADGIVFILPERLIAVKTDFTSAHRHNTGIMIPDGQADLALPGNFKNSHPAE